MIMDVNQIADLIMNNGVAITVIIYFMFRDYKFISELSKSIQRLTDCLVQVDDKLSKFSEGGL